MIKEKRLKILIITLFLFLVGFTKVNAASYTGFDYTANLYDNVNGTLTSVTTSGPTSGTGAYEGYIGYTANSSGGAWLISSPITLISNHTYTLTASIPNECGSLVLSSVNRIGVGTTSNNAKSSYQNNTYVNEIYSRVIGGNNFLIQFAFIPTINGSYIVFPFATSVSCNSSRTILENIVIDDLGINTATEEQINSSLNNQTTTLNNSIQNSTDNIINNQNQNNEELKDTIKDNFNSCRDSYNLAYSVNYANVSSDWGTLVNITSTNIIKGKEYTVSVYLESDSETKAFWNANSGVFDYKIFNVKTGLNRYSYTFTALKDAQNISILLTKQGNGDGILIKPSKVQIQEGSIATKYEEPNQEICSNKIDETNDQLGNLNNSLNDSNVDGSLGSAGSFFDNFTTTDHGGLSGIITAPLVAINQMLNTSCSPMTATFKGKELSLPCGYEFWNRLGAIQDFVNIVLGGMLCYRIIIKLYKLIERIKNPEDDRLEVMDL